MKKLINFLLVLVIGAALGYVFHNPIDTKLKARFGAEKTEELRADAEKGLRKGAKTVGKVIDAGVDVIKEEIDSTKQE